jgi:sugar lactone lactonase YvrE
MFVKLFFCISLTASAGRAQSYVVSTLAGSGATVTPVAASQASVGDPGRVAVDAAGNVYFGSLQSVFKVDSAGNLTRVAGNGRAGYSGDGGPATAAALAEPYGVIVDRDGNVYTADRLNARVRRIDAASGIITTVAGIGTAGFSGDGGSAAQAGLAEPNGLAFDPAERTLYIADVADHRVRIVDLATGLIATFAGTGAAEHSGDGGLAHQAGVFGARAVKVAPDGTVYIL